MLPSFGREENNNLDAMGDLGKDFLRGSHPVLSR